MLMSFLLCRGINFYNFYQGKKINLQIDYSRYLFVVDRPKAPQTKRPRLDLPEGMSISLDIPDALLEATPNSIPAVIPKPVKEIVVIPRM